VRNRLLLAMVGVVALVLAVHDVPLAGYLERVESDRLVTRLERDGFILAGRAEESLEAGTAERDTGLAALVDRYAVQEDVRVVVVDSDGIGVAGSDDGVVGQDFTNRTEIESVLRTGDPTWGARPSQTLGTDLFYVSVPVLSGDEVEGVVRLSAPNTLVTDRAASRVRGLLGVALISLAIAVAIAALVARSVTRPLRRLEQATSDLARGDLSTRAPTDEGPPEIRSLASSFNSMAGRLEQLVARQRDFAGTASHELRTPLTALRLRIEQMAGEGADEATVAAAVAETDRLHRMIEGLLALSRVDDGAVGPIVVDAAATVGDRVEYWRPLAEEREVALTVEAPGSAPVDAMPGSLDQIVDNLIDNALEVSPPGGSIVVAVRPVGHAVEIHVVDDGPGLSEADRVAAFDRFWRAADAPDGGSGLGLAIVRQLVAAVDGSAELHESPSGGIDAVVTLPSSGARP